MVSPTLELAPPSLAPLSLGELIASALVHRADWDRLSLALRRRLQQTTAPAKLLPALVQHRLLTIYQARRLARGQRFGLLLGDYRVTDRIGTGNSAVVFRAEHRDTRRRVAVKVLTVRRDQDRRVMRRFIQEVRIATRLRHPHIVHALGAGAARDPEPGGPVLHYFVMDYVPGHDLEDLVRRDGPLPVDLVVRIARQIADALAESHRRRMVHRDIKPGNIRLTPDGQAKLLDFGLARWGGGLDEPGKPLGTVAYMAPEQVHHAEKVDVRADLYGLGGTLYWCLTGKSPFPVHGGALDQLAARLRLRAPSAREVRPEVPAALDEIVRRLLALQPADRFQTPGQVLQALG